ncbi:hypothetical protein Tco_0073121 [Tanacetum coccineum]
MLHSSEDDEAISQTNTEGDAINFNKNRSFPDDEFSEPKTKDNQCSNSVTSKEPPEFTIAGDLPVDHEPDHAESADILESAEPQDNDIWSREKHIKLVNIIGEPLDGITTRSRVRDSDAASAHECLYVNFLSEIEMFWKKDRTKWIWKNKMDEEGVVTKNKARLVAQGIISRKGLIMKRRLHLLQDWKLSESFLHNAAK